MNLSQFTKSLLAAAGVFLALTVSNVHAQTGTGTGDTGLGQQGIGDQGIETVGIAEADTSAFTIERGDAAGAAPDSVTGGTNAGGRGGGVGGGFGGLGGLFGGLFGNAGQGASSTQPTVRVRLRSAVDVSPLQPSAVQQSAMQRFTTLPGQRSLPSVNVTMQGRTAILSGNVQSNRDRRMSQLLMRLEPGVSNVENRINVIGQ